MKSSSRTAPASGRLPAVLAKTRGRQPFTADGYEQLVSRSLQERLDERLAALDRSTGRTDLPAPRLPSMDTPPPRRQDVVLPPAPDATGGWVRPVRQGWVAKYDPTRADRDAQREPQRQLVANSDVIRDFAWLNRRSRCGNPGSAHCRA